jgi:kynurenine formamidase
MEERHMYADLPNGDAKGVFGDDDVLGTVNLQTADTVRHAAGLVTTGAVFSLNAPLDWPNPPLFNRELVQHHVYRTTMGNRDDWLDGFYPQASSQWDGLLHISDPEIGSYNHLPPELLGIESWAARGIAGRGVLLDVERHLRAEGRPLHWRTRTAITVEDLEATRRRAGVEPRRGDILLVRTGWVAGYEAADANDRAAVRVDQTSPGLAADRAMAEYLWDWGVSAVAADNIGLEAMPLQGEVLHHRLLCRMGMPIGEMWWLDALAEACAADGRYEHLLVSAPLHLRGGVGSPANALAIR